MNNNVIIRPIKQQAYESTIIWLPGRWYFIQLYPFPIFLQFQEQIEWAVEAGADFIIGETFGAYEEAALALDCIKKYGKGKLPRGEHFQFHGS